jgi:hypothetical protein
MGHLDETDDDDDDDNGAWEVTKDPANVLSVGDTPKDAPGSGLDDPLPNILATPAAMTSMEPNHASESNAALPGALAQGKCTFRPRASVMTSMVEDGVKPTCTSEVTLSNLTLPEESANTSNPIPQSTEVAVQTPIQGRVSIAILASALFISVACICARLLQGGLTEGDGRSVAYSSIFQEKEVQATPLSMPQPLSMTQAATPRNVPLWLSKSMSSCAQALRLRLAHS